MLSENERAFAEPAVNIIKKRWPKVWKTLSKTLPTEELDFLPGDGHPSFSLNGIQLSSTFDPIAEAELLISTIDNDAAEAWLYGIGMGYLPRQLLETRGALKKLHVIIFNKALFLALLHWVDQADWLSDQRIILHLPKKTAVPQLPYAITTACLWVADHEAAPLRDRLFGELSADKVDEHWKKKRRRLSQQITKNAELIRHDGDVAELFSLRQKNNQQKLSVIVAGAGPSLDSVTPKIKQKMADGAILIAVDAALKVLLKEKIVPSVVVSIDAHSDQILPLLSNDFSKIDPITLVYFPVVHKEALEAWPFCRLTAFPYADDMYTAIDKQFPKAKLYCSGSVIHPAIDLATKMGATTISLAGADFAYTYGKSHATGVSHQYSPYSDGVVIIERPMIKSGHGKMLESILNLIGYLRDLESFIGHHPDTSFINMSRDGAEIEGAQYED